VLPDAQHSDDLTTGKREKVLHGTKSGFFGFFKNFSHSSWDSNSSKFYQLLLKILNFEMEDIVKISRKNTM
jgi:hypothetical protein